MSESVSYSPVVNVSVQMPLDLVARIDAFRQGRSRARTIRGLVEEALNAPLLADRPARPNETVWIEQGTVTYPTGAAVKEHKQEPKKASVTALKKLVTDTEQRMAPSAGRSHRLAYESSSACKDCGTSRGLITPEQFRTMPCQGSAS